MRKQLSLPVRAAAVLFVAFAAFLGSAGSVGAAGSTLDASVGATVHKCSVIGTDGTYQGVVCLDIDTAVETPGTPNPPYRAYAKVELYCQTPSGATVRCANAYSDTVLANGVGGRDYIYAGCGHANGPCSSGRNVWSTLTQGHYFSYDSYANCDVLGGTDNDVWVVAYSDTSIELPGSDKLLTVADSPNDNGNLSTGHYYVCP